MKKNVEQVRFSVAIVLFSMILHSVSNPLIYCNGFYFRGDKILWICSFQHIQGYLSSHFCNVFLLFLNKNIMLAGI